MSEKTRIGFLKKKKTEILIILGILCAVLLIIISGCEKKGVEKNTTVENYEINIEQRLCYLISKIKGVDQVSVMVTTDCSEEYVYAENVEKNNGNENREFFLDSNKEAVLIKKIKPEIRGVAVVCRGGDEAVIQSKIIDLISSVLEISTNRIFVGS